MSGISVIGNWTLGKEWGKNKKGTKKKKERRNGKSKAEKGRMRRKKDRKRRKKEKYTKIKKNKKGLFGMEKKIRWKNEKEKMAKK